MVLPLADDNSDRKTQPIANYILIAINIFVFVVFQGMGSNDNFTYAFSTVPEEIVTGHDYVTKDRIVRDPMTGEQFHAPGLKPTPIPVWLTIFTSMFMHGGIAHIVGNMWFLFIFGDNIEDDLGHARYVVFYLLCGVIASLSHVFMNAWGDQALVPSLGASGAISGVMGAYMVMHSHRRVRVLLFRVVTDVPGWVAVGIWFGFQLISSLGVLGGDTQGGGGVAYAAHIGGFIAGAILIKPFMLGREPPAPARVF
jgi:membrane associated rhomboid family serine protease